MGSPVEIKLNKKDRAELNSIVSKGTNKARVITRARVLLLTDRGMKPTVILEALDIKALRTIRNVKNRYRSGGLERALHDQPRSGAPNKFEGKHRSKLTALACTDAPEGYAKWSLRLLADKAVELGIVDEISHNQLGLILKKTKLSHT